jgi:hypothetical protein
MNDTIANSGVCVEKLRLMAAHEADTNAFAAAVTNLHERIGTSSKSDCVRARQTIDEARIKSEHSRLALERHVESHQCLARRTRSTFRRSERIQPLPLSVAPPYANAMGDTSKCGLPAKRATLAAAT